MSVSFLVLAAGATVPYLAWRLNCHRQWMLQMALLAKERGTTPAKAAFECRTRELVEHEGRLNRFCVAEACASSLSNPTPEPLDEIRGWLEKRALERKARSAHSALARLKVPAPKAQVRELAA